MLPLPDLVRSITKNLRQELAKQLVNLIEMKDPEFLCEENR